MLSSVIGETLPLTLAISPLTIIAIILMLLSPTARRTGPGFLIGWCVGTAVPVIVFVLLAGVLPNRAPRGDRGTHARQGHRLPLNGTVKVSRSRTPHIWT